jgi:hypothetical protein
LPNTRRISSGFFMGPKGGVAVRPMRISVLLALPVLFCIGRGQCATAADDGHITGTVVLKKADATVVYGDWIRVLLVRRPVAVPEAAGMAAGNKFQRRERINVAHMDFFKRVQSEMADPGYLVASTLTTPDGRFKFPDCPPGRDWVVVTFPSMIRGCKVAWQVPADVSAGQTLSLVLDNANMAVTPDIRD